MSGIRGLGLSEARITGGFWAGKADMVAREMLPYQWLALNDEVPGAEPSHALENFRIAAGESKGEFKGNVWQDSDVAKWIEAASYSLAHHPDRALEANMDEAIRLIAKAQGPDGYVNSYFLVEAPDKRWADLAWGHELYCAGHLIEAAVAHNACTGKRTLLDVAIRYADCIDAAFGAGEGKIRGTCGHPEIELALYRLYRATGERRYRELASFFIRERGRDPAAFLGKEPLAFRIPKTRWFLADYFLAHAPVVHQDAAEGHAVRAVYLYAAMADECAETGDAEMAAALRTLWDSAVSRRMYVTGGIGSQAQAERFTTDYDLPSGTAYNETCASVGLAMWASRMARLEADSRYADVAERAIYNGVLCGVSLDGTRYFYVNPLELRPDAAARRQDHEHVQIERVAWHGCACCPPNVARLIASMPSYLCGVGEGSIWLHHYAESEVEASLGGTRFRIKQTTAYPWSGLVSIEVEPEREAEAALMLRIPDWCASFSSSVNGKPLEAAAPRRGYLEVRRHWKSGDKVQLELGMLPRILRADPRIPELAGRLAVQRGPLVYCAEELDNGPDLHLLELDPAAPIVAEPEAALGGALRLVAEGYRSGPGSGPAQGRAPYYEASSSRPVRTRARIVLVPYHLWGNRAPGREMRVWLRGG